ncbi:cytochrome c oxidase assembly factor 3, mitochondrial [Aethina tumida]|uniref:cytochrome c oxidase assembly factor 3, mitochondrial n=1 Tax=Aethina tumida TaxID=116153 RepID=UPI00096B4AF4|nr:cytochrome c oxidase assembly factor 3, mitochondrial [Aethina tumida]
MSESNRMPKIDVSKLKPSELEFIQRFEKENRIRVEKLKRLRRNNLITAGILGVSILGIYGYSMYAVRQETFLDDFDEPAKTTQ